MAEVKVTLRFHGRFLYAEGARTGVISAIAAQYDERGAGRHQTLMTIRHDHVIFKDSEKRQITTFHPHFRVTSPDIDKGDVELMVWDLAGLTVSYDSPGPSTLTPVEQGDIYHVGALEDLRRRRAHLDTAVLRPDRRRSNAVIELTDAEGVSQKPEKPVTMELAGEESIRKGNPDRLDHPKVPTDVVVFTVKVPAPGDEKTPCLTLTFRSESDEIVGAIALKANAAIGVSNSCSQIEEPAEHDLEFSRYYDLLTSRREKDVLIPILKPNSMPPSEAHAEDERPVEPRLMEGMRCYIVSTIGFNEP